jgi:hypothetical protein
VRRPTAEQFFIKEVSACHTFFRLSNFFGSALRLQTFLSPTTINGTKISFLPVF